MLTPHSSVLDMDVTVKLQGDLEEMHETYFQGKPYSFEELPCSVQIGVLSDTLYASKFRGTILEAYFPPI